MSLSFPPISKVYRSAIRCNAVRRNDKRHDSSVEYTSYAGITRIRFKGPEAALRLCISAGLASSAPAILFACGKVSVLQIPTLCQGRPLRRSRQFRQNEAGNFGRTVRGDPVPPNKADFPSVQQDIGRLTRADAGGKRKKTLTRQRKTCIVTFVTKL